MKTKILTTAAVAALLGCWADTVKYVDEFDLNAMSCGMGRRPQARRSLDGNPLRLGEGRYDRGVGTHPESAIGFALNGKASAFDAVVGIDRDAKDVKGRSGRAAGAIFRVWVDGKVVADTGTIREKDQPKALHVDLRGAKEVVLETASYAPWCGFESSNADWADAKFTLADGGTVEALSDPKLLAQLGILTPAEKPEPQFNGADIWGVRPGHPVIFRVPVSGVRPMKFSATGLPAGVTLDSAKEIKNVTRTEGRIGHHCAVFCFNVEFICHDRRIAAGNAMDILFRFCAVIKFTYSIAPANAVAGGEQGV